MPLVEALIDGEWVAVYAHDDRERCEEYMKRWDKARIVELKP